MKDWDVLEVYERGLMAAYWLSSRHALLNWDVCLVYK